MNLDFTDPRLLPAIQMLVQKLHAEVSSYIPPEGITLGRQQKTVWDGETIDCYVLEPEGGCPKLPTMLYCHGGGFSCPSSL